MTCSPEGGGSERKSAQDSQSQKAFRRIFCFVSSITYCTTHSDKVLSTTKPAEHLSVGLANNKLRIPLSPPPKCWSFPRVLSGRDKRPNLKSP